MQNKTHFSINIHNINLKIILLIIILLFLRYNPPVDKFHDFAESGITWYGTHEAWVYSLKGSPDKDAQIIVENFRVRSFTLLHICNKSVSY